MDEFNERVHAYIAARYYEQLTEKFGERGKKAFIHATQYYAEQRGRRMAQRAIRDGKELTYQTYQEYGEWVNTDYTIENGWSNQATVTNWAPDLETHITRCPWHTQFKEMGLVEAGHTYCAHLDNSICRGFNPYITYDVLQTLHKSDYCIHILRDVNYEVGESHPKKKEYLKNFEYHCAHSFWSYAEVTEAIFLSEGKEVVENVLKVFTEDYGQEMADTLVRYRNTNFNVCD
ncbi:MAG: L-2-amino-thiazoline-4-carboxylic acid hydrolase [Solobacterium sp.]|nr:L-2-amino-thiazoline-4-carboxylic acid hydrolase [Solobacterium sp.]